MTPSDPQGAKIEILVIEDNPDDAFLLLHLLGKSFPGSKRIHAAGRKELESYLDGGNRPDIILSDWSLPQFNGLAALEIVRSRGVDAPFLIVSGKIGEEAATTAIRQGVFDYVLKDNLARLPTAIGHALDQYENEKKTRLNNATLALQATALRAAPDAIAIFTPDGRIEQANPAFEELTGYASGELQNVDIRTLCIEVPAIPQESVADDLDAPREWLVCGLATTKSGRPYLEEEKFCPVYGPNGTLAHIVVIKKDISAAEQRKLELEQDLWLSTAIGQTKNPGVLCQRVVSFLRERHPDCRCGIRLSPAVEEQEALWFGEPWDMDTQGEPDQASGRAGWRLLSRDFRLGQESLGSIRIEYQETSPIDRGKLFDALARQLEGAIQRIGAQRKVAAQVRNISFLQLIGRTISGDMDFETFAAPLLRQIQKFLDADAVSLFLTDKDSATMTCRAQSGFKTSLIEGSVVNYGDSYVGQAAVQQRIISMPVLVPAAENRGFAALIEGEKFVSQFCAPIIVAGKTTGVLEVFTRKQFSPSPEWTILLDAIAAQTGLALDYNAIYADLQRAYLDLELSYEATIEGWSTAMDYRDQETEGHSKRVTALTLSLASRLGIAEDRIAQYGRGALLHDVGKIGIPDNVLKKEGPLNDEEWALMRRHPAIAYDLLSRIPYLKDSLEIPLYHHEKWDGSGYPKGLRGEDIPVAARLFSVVDVFDALTSDRPYRRAWTKADTLRYIKEQSGRQFDPHIVDVFIKMIGE